MGPSGPIDESPTPGGNLSLGLGVLTGLVKVPKLESAAVAVDVSSFLTLDLPDRTLIGLLELCES
jgi:hypothetical protein